MRRRTTAFRPEAVTCVIHQHVAHHRGGHGEKMRAILPAGLLIRKEPNEGFLHERGRLNLLAIQFAAQAAASDPLQLGPNQRKQQVQRGLIPLSPACQQPCDLSRWGHAGTRLSESETPLLG